MCGGHHHRRGGEARGFGGRRRGGWRGFPNRDELVERLTGYREHLESELANVQQLLERLADGTEQQPEPGSI
jgi:hypothetical protein